MNWDLLVKKGEEAYTISSYSQMGKWKFFLENDYGEEIEIPEEDFFNILDKYFKEKK